MTVHPEPAKVMYSHVIIVHPEPAKKSGCVDALVIYPELAKILLSQCTDFAGKKFCLVDLLIVHPKPAQKKISLVDIFVIQIEPAKILLMHRLYTRSQQKTF